MVTKADTPKASYWHDQDLAPPQRSSTMPSLEAELRTREASFWQAISDFIVQRLATLNFD